jgi:cytoskeletal protein CcmA (bactofilin family)
MSIANIKSKLKSSISGDENTLVRKLENISSSFKSTPTIISKDSKIEGNIYCNGIIEIEGIVNGIIKGNSIIIREDGFIEGEIIAESLNIRGKFDGSIKARSISISSKAKVTGDINYGSLCVEDGASIDGQFKKIES